MPIVKFVACVMPIVKFVACVMPIVKLRCACQTRMNLTIRTPGVRNLVTMVFLYVYIKT